MKKQVILFLFAVICSLAANAQIGGVLYSSSRVPQMNVQNPVFYPSNNTFYISLPSVGLNFVSPISYEDIVTFNTEKDEDEININNIIDNHGDGARTQLDLNVLGLGGGFRKNNLFMTFSSQVMATVNLGVPSGLLTFLKDGYVDDGTSHELYLIDGDLLSAQVYTEYALGGGYTFFDRLTVAAKVKLLEGYFDLHTTDSYLKIYKAADMTSLKADVYYNLLTSSLAEDENIDLFPRNFGIAFDFGAKYEWNGFEFSASILDVGKGIHWKDNVKNRVPADGGSTFDIPGIHVSDGKLVVDTMSADYRDSFERLLDFETTDGEDYWTKLPMKLNLGVMYSPVDMLKFGVLYHGEVDQNVSEYNNLGEIVKASRLRSSASVMGCLNLSDWFELMLCNSVVSNGKDVDWLNPGLGINLSLFRTFQMYLTVDYVSDIRIVEAKQLKMGFGINLLFGNGRKSAKAPKVPDEDVQDKR